MELKEVKDLKNGTSDQRFVATPSEVAMAKLGFIASGNLDASILLLAHGIVPGERDEYLYRNDAEQIVAGNILLLANGPIQRPDSFTEIEQTVETGIEALKEGAEQAAAIRSDWLHKATV